MIVFLSLMFACEGGARQTRPLDLFDPTKKNLFDNLEKSAVRLLILYTDFYTELEIFFLNPLTLNTALNYSQFFTLLFPSK